jgi:hypothetical protein
MTTNLISLYLESNKFLKLWNNGWSTRLKGRTFPTNSFIRASSIQACLVLDILLSISIMLDVILDCTWEGRPERKTVPVLWSDLGCLPSDSYCQKQFKLFNYDTMCLHYINISTLCWLYKSRIVHVKIILILFTGNTTNLPGSEGRGAVQGFFSNKNSLLWEKAAFGESVHQRKENIICVGSRVRIKILVIKTLK